MTSLGRIRKGLIEGKAKSDCQTHGLRSWGNRVALDLQEQKNKEMLTWRLRWPDGYTALNLKRNF